MFRNFRIIKTKNARSLVLIGTLAILAVSSVFMTIETATGSLEVSRLEAKETDLTNQRKSLEQELVKNLSVTDLQSKSSGLGFVKPTSLVYISSLEPVAKLP